MPAAEPPPPAPVPSAELLETAFQSSTALQSSLALSDLFSLWRSVSETLASSLLRGRGVKIDSFCTFTFNTRGEASWFADDSFLLSSHLKQSKKFGGRPVVSSTISTQRLNVSACADVVRIPARVALKAAESVVATFGASAKGDGRAEVQLAFHPLGVMRLAAGEIYFEYAPEFLARLAKVKAGDYSEEKQREENAEKKKLVEAAAAKESARQKSAGGNNSNTNTNTNNNNTNNPPPPHRPFAAPAADAGFSPRPGQPNKFLGDGSSWPPRLDSAVNNKTVAQQRQPSPRGGLVPPPPPPARPPPPSGGVAALMGASSSRQGSAVGIPGVAKRATRPNPDAGGVAALMGGLTVDVKPASARRQLPPATPPMSPGEALRRKIDAMKQRTAGAAPSPRPGLPDRRPPAAPPPPHQAGGFVDNVPRRGARELASAARRSELSLTLQLCRSKLFSKFGSYALRSLGRVLTSMDEDGSGDLSPSELRKAFEDVGVKLTGQQAADVFAHFDVDKSGAVSFGEFMDGIRGDTFGERRRDAVVQAFRHADASGDGDLSIKEMKDRFSCDKDPAVLDGSQSKEQVTKEFLCQWDKARGDGTVDVDDFIAFYKDVGSVFDDDDDFILSLMDSWGFDFQERSGEARSGFAAIDNFYDDAQYGGSYGVGGGGSPRGRGGNNYVAPPPVDPLAADLAELMALIYTPPRPLDPFICHLGASQVSACPALTTAQFSATLRKLSSKSQIELSSRRAAELTDAVASKLGIVAGGSIPIEKLHAMLTTKLGGGGPAAGGGSIIDVVKSKMLAKCGSDGLRAIRKVLEVMDGDGTKQLSKQELKGGLADWGLSLNMSEIDAVFTFFDRDRSGAVAFDELLEGLRGPMSDRRKELVNKAFEVVDRTAGGEVTIKDIIDVCDVSQHPMVLNGTSTREEILSHMIDLWDTGTKDGVVTREEFMEYYADVGAAIDGDDFFELMIKNAWHIDESNNNLSVLCKFKSGVQHFVTVRNDLGLLRPNDKENDKRRIMAQLIKEEAGKSEGGVVDIDIAGAGFDKKSRQGAKTATTGGSAGGGKRPLRPIGR